MHTLIITSIIFSSCILYKNKVVIEKLLKKWKRINNLVATTETNGIMIQVISAKLSFLMLRDKITERYEKTNVRKITKGLYEVSYKIESRKYKMIVEPASGGPAPILQITNNLGEDVTGNVMEYMGPKYDWHLFYHSDNKEFIPCDFFNCDSLHFEMSDGDTQILYASGKEPSNKED